jgi:hypothetical protein
MRNFDKLGTEARALFHASTGYCATPGARARAAWLARQEEEKAVQAARSLRKPFNSQHQFRRKRAK